VKQICGSRDRLNRQGVTLTERERDTACHAPLEKCHSALNMFPYVRFLDPVTPLRGGIRGWGAFDLASRALVSVPCH
jgi:hypothetical protein